jgi:hypothetical protein
VDISACTDILSIGFTGDFAGGTITGSSSKPAVTSWPSILGATTLSNLTGVSGVPLIILAGSFPAVTYDNLLLENGDALLLENGDNLLLEH